ncbi:hypothetical protein HYX08_05780 [Candidatus Woesearchaeota archaeon]|nr:hypothetical protein [Candidatus Woesearchaeota archaeon]
MDKDNKIKILKNDIESYKFIITFFTFMIGIFYLSLQIIQSNITNYIFIALISAYLVTILAFFALGLQKYNKIKIILNNKKMVTMKNTKKKEYVKNLIIGTFAGIIASIIFEVKEMDVTSVGYWITLTVVLILVIIVGWIGWRVVSKI